MNIDKTKTVNIVNIYKYMCILTEQKSFKQLLLQKDYARFGVVKHAQGQELDAMPTTWQLTVQKHCLNKTIRKK